MERMSAIRLMRNEYFVYIRPFSGESFDSSEWFLTQMLRWGQIEQPLDIRATAAVYRPDLYRDAARALGVPAPTASSTAASSTRPARSTTSPASTSAARTSRLRPWPRSTNARRGEKGGN